MGKEILGEFEHQLLLATLRVGADAYSVTLVTELEERTGREVAPAAVYIALKRLEQKGLAASELRAAPPEEGGRERRYYRVTPAGRDLLLETRRRLERLWDGLGDALEGGG